MFELLWMITIYAVSFSVGVAGTAATIVIMEAIWKPKLIKGVEPLSVYKGRR